MADLATKELGKQGFLTFAPKLITKLVKDEETLVDLFPGYRFVQFDVTRGEWPKVHYTYGVRRLMPGLDLRPATVPISAMTELLGKPIRHAKHLLVVEPVRLAPSSEIVAVDGPFAGFPGTVVSMLPQDRIVALMSVFGRSSKVEMALVQVRKA